MFYDVLILGGGPAGLTAAIYASRAKLSVLVLEKMTTGGAMVVSENIDNYPGFPEGISGAELGRLLEEQAKKSGAEIKWGNVVKFEDQGNIKVVSTIKEEYKGKTVIVCTGTGRRTLGVPGEEEFKGRGISFCATCDAPLFKNKNVLVVGGGNAAVQEAVYLTRFADKVYIAHRGNQLRAEKNLQEKVFADKKIELLLNTVVKEVRGEGLVEGVLLLDKKTGKEWFLKLSGIFLFIGVHPNTIFLEDAGIKMDDKGYVITTEKMETSLAGVFAAGDVREKKVRQIITAASDGAVAANMARAYIRAIQKT